jgi:type III secretion system FlhB-like substrate exporter
MDSQDKKYGFSKQVTDEKAVVEALLNDKQLFENPELVRRMANNMSEAFPEDLHSVIEETLKFFKSMDAQSRKESYNLEVEGA